MRIYMYLIFAIGGLIGMVLITVLNWELTDRELVRAYPGISVLATGYFFWGLGGLTELFLRWIPEEKEPETKTQ